MPDRPVADAATGARRRTTIADPGSFRAHDHVAWRGDGSEELGRVAVGAFRTAALRGDLLVFVAEEPQPERLAALGDIEALLDRGALRLITIDDAYVHQADPDRQLAIFETELGKALEAGFAGACVVADNTRCVTGSDEEFARWLAWEAMTDRLQAARPLNGVCFFDAGRIPDDRLSDLATVHPVLSGEFEPPSFQLFVDGDSAIVTGALDHWSADRLRRILSNASTFSALGLDLSAVEFVDHRALLALQEVASHVGPIQLRGASPIVRKVWELLDVDSPALEFC
jgi:anti-anti-sigma regulatory factor